MREYVIIYILGRFVHLYFKLRFFSSWKRAETRVHLFQVMFSLYLSHVVYFSSLTYFNGTGSGINSFLHDTEWSWTLEKA